MNTSSVIRSLLLLGLSAAAPAAAAKAPEVSGGDTAVVTFHVNMLRSIASGGIAPGDTILLRIENLPLPAPPFQDILCKKLIGASYAATDTLLEPAGTTLYYHYMRLRNGAYAPEETFMPFMGSTERTFDVPGSSLDVFDTSSCASCARRLPYFLNTNVLRRAVSVLWEIDMRPAWHKVATGDTLPDLAGTVNVTRADSVMRSGVFINGPATGGWQTWGTVLRNDTTRMLFDDGTHGDVVAGDSIFSRIIEAAAESLGIGTKGQVGQVFRFSIGGGDNEGGPGSFGVYHYDNVDDTGDKFAIAEEWGSINPAFYAPWDYGVHTPILSVKSPLASLSPSPGYALYQNYPNPFNPETRIRYDLPQAGRVTIIVYNLLGERVSVALDSNQSAGPHEVRLSAGALASGVYVYRLSAGSFVQSKMCTVLR